MFQKVMAGEFQFLDNVVKISEEAKDLICKLLDPNPVTRLSLRDAQSHPWLRESLGGGGATYGSYLANYDKFLVE